MTTRRTMLTILVSEDEKKTLEELASVTGGGGMSAYVRRLIRQEAVRLGLVQAGNGTAPDAEAVPA